MHSKNKPAPTAEEARYIGYVARLPCVVCQEPPRSDVHEPEQGLWHASIALCPPCHTGPKGWHGTRLRWSLRKMDELKAIAATVRGVLALMADDARAAGKARTQ